MQYKELESQVYALLRSGRLAEAVIRVSQPGAIYAGADRYEYLLLKASVQLLASPFNMAACAEMIDDVLAAPMALPDTKLKATFSGAQIAGELKDPSRWRGYLAQMAELLRVDPRFGGRAIRCEGYFEEVNGTLGKAIAYYESSLAWHLENVGPYDERDRLCYVGLTCADLVRLYTRNGDVPAARKAADTARASIPEGVFQRVYVPMSDLRVGLATNSLAEAGAALSEARAMLAKYPNGYIARQLDELEAALLQRQGCPNQAQGVLEGLTTKGRASRNLSALRSSQALTVQGW